MQTQNILSIREDTLSCDAQKPGFTRDAVMSEYSDVFGEELGLMEGKLHLETDSNVAPPVMLPRHAPVLGNIPRYVLQHDVLYNTDFVLHRIQKIDTHLH